MYIVTCKDCGKTYQAARNRDGYCESCRARRMAETRHRYYEKRKEHRKEVSNTIPRCENCGKKFVPSNDSQKLCEKCQFLKESNYRMTNSNQYRKEHTDAIQFKVPKGNREVLKECAADRGMNLTEFILDSIRLNQSIYSLPEEERQKIYDILEQN